MLCDNCLEIMVSKLKEGDIAVLQHMYNNNVTIPQFAQNKYTIAKELNVKVSASSIALYRLECFNFVAMQNWTKSNNFYLTQDGLRALEILIRKMEV